MIYNYTENAALVDWRTLCFLRLGFTSMAAYALAARRDIDREDVRHLLEHGATHDQTCAILL